MYRFLKSERFKRILFLVDRRTLGSQATDVFNDVTIEKNLPLSKSIILPNWEIWPPKAETRIQVATVQAMVLQFFAQTLRPWWSALRHCG